MTPEEIAALEQEKKTNAGTITGLQTRIRISQEEIDALTKRNAAIDAQLAKVVPPPEPE